MLSSSWETEQKTYNMVDVSNSKNNWMVPEIRKEITVFQDTQIEAEFSRAVENHSVEEIYWVGGEPLMYEQHWRYMRRIIELGDGKNVYARYNTNLSRINHRGINLYSDILAHIRDWQICASLDGTGATGEYIRTGLDYGTFLKNFQEGLQYATNPRQMRLDFTLTLPGMTEVISMEKLAAELGVELLVKVVFSFTPDIVLSPLAMPVEVLHPWLDLLIEESESKVMRDVLLNLKTRPTFDQKWTGSFQESLAKGKARVLKLESIRSARTGMAEILAAYPPALEWWNQIGTD
jgi:hypothetical protein